MDKTAYVNELKTFLGTEVTVIIDRPLRSVHPERSDIVYAVNYGYLPEVYAPDDEEQDVYVLGVDEPVDSFTGVVIAIIYREDDVESKLVVAPKGVSFTDEEIRSLVDFQERFFVSSLIR